jgi:hypothetical protein
MEPRKADQQGDSPLFASAGRLRQTAFLAYSLALLLILLAQTLVSQHQTNKANAASFILSLFLCVPIK